jgi:uncharacterized protein (DUF736 family)
MPAIGHVTRTSEGGFAGELRTISIRVPLEIVPSGCKNGSARPDYRVLSDGVEFGAGWNRRSEASGEIYVSLSLAAPEFGPRRIYVNLAPVAGDNRDLFVLRWIPAD